MAAKKAKKPAITGLGRPEGIIDDIFESLGKKAVGELRRVARKEVKAYKPSVYRTEQSAGKIYKSKDGGLYSKIEHGYAMKPHIVKSGRTKEILEHRATIERAVKKQTGVGNKKSEDIAAKIFVEERAAVAKRAAQRAKNRKKGAK